MHKYKISLPMNTLYRLTFILAWLVVGGSQAIAAEAAAGAVAASEDLVAPVAAPAAEVPVTVEIETRTEAELPALEEPANEVLPGAEPPADPESLPAAVRDANATLKETLESAAPESPAVADAYESLALAEMQAGMYDAAEVTLNREISYLEEQLGVYAARLARPLSLLGEVYQATGRLDDAVEAYRRAQHVVHRADGVYTLEQLDYLDQISRVYVEKRLYAEADRHHRLAFFVSEQNFGPESPELVPALMKLGRWYNRVGKVRESRRLFERASHIIEEQLGPEHPALIEPLLALGTTTRKKGQYRKQREQALTRMVKLVEGDPTLDATDRAGAWARMGDFYVMVDDRQKAADAYRKSWEALHESEGPADTKTALLAEPMILDFQRRIYLMDRTPRSGFGGLDMSLEEFALEMEFEVDVGPDGKVRKVRVLNLETTAATRRQIRRYIRDARFRPRVVDGEPVLASGIRFKETVTIVRPEGS